MERIACWYSVVRYTVDAIAGEVVNVGVILHSIYDKNRIRYLLLDEHSNKIRAISNCAVDLNTYKSYKNMLDYYLDHSTENLFGYVGKVKISSPNEENFMSMLYEHFKKKNMFLSEPTFCMTSDMEGLFKSLFETYVGAKYLELDHKVVSTKKYIKSIFEERKLINTKVASDISIEPVPELKAVRINIDFGFKNGVWNYIQAVPSSTGLSKNTDWFAKMKFMFDSITDTNAKYYIMYRGSDNQSSMDLSGVVDYLTTKYQRVTKFDLDNKIEVENLCSFIAKEAHDIKDVLVS